MSNEPTNMAQLMALVGPAKKAKTTRLRKGRAKSVKTVHGTLRTHAAPKTTVRTGHLRTKVISGPKLNVTKLFRRTL